MKCRIPEKLIFNEIGMYTPLPAEPKIGMVGCHSADRAPSWGYFIVVGTSPEKKTIRVITPAMRYVGGVMEFGTTSIPNPVECTCHYHQDGDDGDFYCNCGAGILNEKQYNDSFIPCDEFAVTEMDLERKTAFIYLELAQQEMLEPYHDFDPEQVKRILG